MGWEPIKKTKSVKIVSTIGILIGMFIGALYILPHIKTGGSFPQEVEDWIGYIVLGGITVWALDDVWNPKSKGWKVQRKVDERIKRRMQKKVEKDPCNLKARFRLIKWHLRFGDSDSAFEEYQILETLDEDWANKLLNSINKWEKWGEDWGKMTEEFKKRIETSRKSAVADIDGVEKCENCERLIGKSETPWVLNNRVVCAECYRWLKASQVSKNNE